MRLRVATVLVLLAIASTLAADDRPPAEAPGAVDISLLSVRVTPGVDFTIQPSVQPLYSALSYGVDLLGWLPIPSLPFVAPAVGIDYSLVPVRAETAFSSVGVGLGIAGVYDRGRFQLTASALGGGYFSFMHGTIRDITGTAYPDQSGAAGYLSAGVDGSFFITPFLNIGLGAMYHNMLGLYHGIRVHVNAALNLNGLRRHVDLDDVELAPVFPVLVQYYSDNPVGEAIVTNGERFPISNIRVEMEVPEYMTAPVTGTTVDVLAPGESAPVKFRALFAERILTLQEGAQLPVSLTVHYELNGRERESVVAGDMRFHNRNGLVWDDDRKAAAFVSSKDPEIIRFASAVAGMVRAEGPASVNPNLRLAMGMFEALSLYGLSYVIDPNTPAYIDASENPSVIDFLQFPRQTLDYRGGDCDDLSILYTSLLEAVGVPTAFVTIPGHIFTAFSLNVPTDEAVRMFMDPGAIMDVDGTAWLAVETTLVGESFESAWSTGADQWHANLQAGAAGIYPMSECWSLYPPSGYPVAGSEDERISIDLPDPDALALAYRQEVISLVQRQLQPQVDRLRESIGSSRNPERLLNRLGVLYAQYGLEQEARLAFQEALLADSYAPAMINLANLHYLAGNLEDALYYYELAAATTPDDPAVLLGLARVNHEMDRIAQARIHFAALQDAAPQIGEEFGYLASAEDGGTRAADADVRRQRVLWVGEDEQ